MTDNTSSSSSASSASAHQPTQEKPAKTFDDAASESSDDDDIDALIDELQSNPGVDGSESEDDGPVAAGEARLVPEELLQTDPSYGLTSDEVLKRRKKYGLNQMAENNESLIIKFIMFFVGPCLLYTSRCV